MEIRLRFRFVVWVFTCLVAGPAFLACSGKKTPVPDSVAPPDSHVEPAVPGEGKKIQGGSLSPHGPVGQLDSIPPPKGHDKLDYTFPDTLCGNLVRRLLECETEQLMKRDDIKESMRRSLATTKRRRFAQNRSQYLKHCEKTVSRIPEEAVRACLEHDCPEMDRCLQKIAGQTDAK